MTVLDTQRFIRVFNDTTGFPDLADVALELGIAYQTVRNYAVLIRKRIANGEDLPALVSRLKRAAPEKIEPTPHEHARKRAGALAGAIETLLVRSRYPVINPEAVVVESNVTQRYDRELQRMQPIEGVPRTWLSDTLRVAPVKQAAGLRFIFTGAQNDAPVHEAFWANLKAYADAVDAEIIVGPWTYETQWWSENNPTSRAYDPVLKEHLCFGQMAIGDKFVFCGEMNTLPTASRPISDLVTYSRGRWAVFPHAKLQLKSVPSTDPGQQAHQVMTSGAVTRPKVIPRKAGVKSIFHHVIGATLVEFDEDGDVFCRQINAADDGSFYDLDCKVDGGHVIRGQSVRAIVCGDIHARKLGPANRAAVFEGPDSLVGFLKPGHLFLHDVHDNEARNHHHAKDVSHDYEMAIRKRDGVLDEVVAGVDFLSSLRGLARNVVVVDSNHDLALERYIREGRYRMDGKNFAYGLKLDAAYHEWRAEVAHALDQHEKPRSFSLLEHAMRQVNPLDHVEWVHDGQSFVVDGVECGHHGFRGANGAKGTVSGFATLGRKMSIGDKHSPEIMDGVYCAGVMELQHGYNKGPSGWAVAHIVQYPNGKRSLVTMQKGKWRASF